jgi:hypothetical protein
MPVPVPAVPTDPKPAAATPPPALPAVPTVVGGKPEEKPQPKPSDPPPALPAPPILQLPGGPADPKPAAASDPKTDPKPAEPKTTPIAPVIPAPTDPIPAPASVNPAGPTPVPSIPDLPAVGAPAALPGLKPIAVTPEPVPAAQVPKKDPSAGTAAALTGVKPVEEPAVRPAGDRTRTDFDVDLHDPKPEETYQTISKLYYGDAKYAEALRAFNQGLPLGRRAPVEVPPIWVLRKRYAPSIGSRPAGDPGPGVEWSSPVGRGESPSPSTYTVPRTGMTMKDVAVDVFGTAQEWRQLWDLNPRIDPSAGLPAGTRLELPAGVKK